MISDTKLRVAISNLGWVDKGNLWIYDNRNMSCNSFPLSDSKYLSLFEGNNDYFSICHNFEDTRFDISIHHFDDPVISLCKLTFDNYKTKIEGNKDIIRFVPQYYLARLKIHDNFNSHLILIQEDKLIVDDSKIEWYNNGHFDFNYQGLSGVYEFNDELLFCVQRNGSIYRLNKLTNELISKVDLAQHGGNPKIIFYNDKTRLITDDYNTILLVNTMNWRIEKKVCLQESENGISQFIGSFNLSKKNDLITLARPFSSDVIMLDNNLKIRYTCKIGRQPLEAIVLESKKVIARDWKTGDLLTGKMKRKFLA
jgi:hypothetical protein